MITEAGWVFILDTKQSNQLLLVDTPDEKFASALAHFCKSICVVHFDSNVLQRIEMKMKEQGIRNATFICAHWDDQQLNLPSEYYDGVIIRNIDSLCCSNQQSPSSEWPDIINSFHSELNRVLKKDGFLFVSYRNRFGYNRFVSFLRKPWNYANCSGNKIPLLKRYILAGLRNAGFLEIRRYNLITDGELVSEVILEKKYRPSKNSFTLKEKIRSHLLSGILSNIFAPSVGIVYAKNDSQINFLDGLLSELTRNLVLEKYSENIIVKKYLVLPGKVILSIGPKRSKYGDWIVILPLSNTVFERLRHEATILDRLHKTSITFKYLVPKFLLQRTYLGQEYFVQQEIPGTTIDAPVRDLDRITRNALNVLLQLHAESKREVLVDDGLYVELYRDPLFRVAEKLGPAANAIIKKIEAILNAILMNKLAILVWSHGDYKIENLMIDPECRAVSGVIDWDLSRQNGLPFLDLMYLIVYNRHIREAKTIDEIFIDIFLNDKLSDEESSLCRKYCKDIGLRTNELDVLINMFWIYHVAYRIEVDATNKHELDRHLNTLHEIEDRTSVFFKHNQEVAAK